MQRAGGTGLIRDGSGYRMSPGAGQHIITADGFLMIIRDGFGFREQPGLLPGSIGIKALNM